MVIHYTFFQISHFCSFKISQIIKLKTEFDTNISFLNISCTRDLIALEIFQWTPEKVIEISLRVSYSLYYLLRPHDLSGALTSNTLTGSSPWNSRRSVGIHRYSPPTFTASTVQTTIIDIMKSWKDISDYKMSCIKVDGLGTFVSGYPRLRQCHHRPGVSHIPGLESEIVPNSEIPTRS